MQIAIPERSISAFRQALEALNNSNIPFVIGGAFSIFHYSGMWRNTNDLDIYMERSYLPSAVRVLTEAGFRDYGEMAAGDNEWIHHAVKYDTLVDIIWQPPNHMVPVDESIYARGPHGTFLDVPVRFLPADELVWTKLFTMNRHRCDWPDIFHVVRGNARDMDWWRLLNKIGDNWPVLLSFIILFDWTYPSDSPAIPEAIREELLDRKRKVPIMSNGPIRESTLDPWIYTRPVSP